MRQTMFRGGGAILALVVACLIFATAGTPAAAGEPGGRGATATLYEQAKAGSVEVLVNGHLQGTGWFADPKGLLLAASHMFERPGQRVEVVSPRQGRLEAKVLAVDRGHDLTLLKVEPRPGGFPALKLAPQRPAAGDEVFILGAPLYRHTVLFRGTTARDDTTFECYGEQYVEVMHLAATVPGGMSGGAWLNAAGEVVGLQSGVMSHDTIPVGIAFAGPLEAIRTLLKTEHTAATPTLGAALEELWSQDDKLLARYPPLTEGLVVRRLQDDGPAVRAGLKIFDLIIAADGKKIRLTDELLRIVCGKQPGQPLELTLLAPDGAGGRKTTVRLGKLEIAWP
ncbi:MAG: S1C family serine protease [Thermoguttaceae bacterium]